MSTSIAQQWLDAVEGSTIEVPSGDYGRVTLKPSKRPKGSAPVRILGVGPTKPRFLQDTAVGSTDTLNLKSGVRDLILENLYLQVDDRAGILTEAPDGARKLTLIDCTLEGVGAGPYDSKWKNDSKWAQLHNRTGAISEIGTVTRKVYNEWGRYFHTTLGNHAFSRCVTEWCGRGAYQFVARMKETGVPQPVGYGDITIIDDVVRDCGINDGGFVYSFKGGMPTTNILLENSIVKLGCDPTLKPPFNKWIAGIFLTESAPESATGAGDAAHPGGQATCKIIRPRWEVGTVYPGEGSAKRTLAKIGALQDCLLDWGDGGFILQNGGNGIALEVFNSCSSFRYSGAPAKWNGKLRYKKDPEYADWADFAAAHPELRV